MKYYYQNYPISRKNKIYQYSQDRRKKYISNLEISTISIMLVDILISLSFLKVILLLSFCLHIALRFHMQEFKAILKEIYSLCIRYKPVIIMFATVNIFLLINLYSEPAYAQFYRSAETWMTSTFAANNTGVGTVIPLAFNVLRGLFLLYLGMSLVKVIQSARQDEDWQNLARTPMIILIAVTVGDILSTLITGTGGAATGT